MKTKKNISLLLSVILVLSIITGCNAKVSPEAASSSGTSNQSNTTSENKLPIKMLVRSDKYQTEANVVRDFLTKLGFEVELNMQPDYSSFKSVLKSGAFDIALNSWATIEGTGDYAIRDLAYSTGELNFYGINDKPLDEGIDKAATLTVEESKPVYAEVERILIEEGYMAPLGMNPRLEAFNKEKIESDTIGVYVARAKPFEDIDFVDKSYRDKEPLIGWQSENWFQSADPIRSNENSTYLTNTNMYCRLINMDENVKPTTEGSLSLNYSIGENNDAFYFLLRDDINFAKVENKIAVNTGERVGAEDVIYSINRARNKDAVPEHAAYGLYKNIADAVIVTDLSELENAKDSDTGKSVKEVLENGLSGKINELVADKTKANNAGGKYQVVKLTTDGPFPQVICFVGHHTSGIVSKKQVESINSKVDFANYDKTKDILYGDDATLVDGPTYDNQLYTSGPYIMTYRNDYEIVLQKNPGYMVGTENEPKIKNVIIKMIKDKDSALSALRSGEIHMLDSVDENKIDLIKQDSKLELKMVKGVNLIYLSFNTNPYSICSDKNIRLAIQNAMDQDAIASVFNGMRYPGQTTISTILETGYKFKPNPSKAQGYLDLHFESNK